jgi:hypothetical protein
MRVCGKHFKKEDYIYMLNMYVHSILRLYFEMIYWVSTQGTCL